MMIMIICNICNLCARNQEINKGACVRACVRACVHACVCVCVCVCVWRGRKLEDPTHNIDKYNWIILGSVGCAERCAERNLVSCQKMTDARFISVERRTRTSMECGFNCIKSPVSGCPLVSTSQISKQLRAAPFIVIIVYVYAPTSGHSGCTKAL